MNIMLVSQHDFIRGQASRRLF